MKAYRNRPFWVQMTDEVQSNRHKGPWEKWEPTRDELASEINHHLIKLLSAIDLDDPARVREFSADVANIAERAYSVYGKQDYQEKFDPLSFTAPGITVEKAYEVFSVAFNTVVDPELRFCFDGPCRTFKNLSTEHRPGTMSELQFVLRFSSTKVEKDFESLSEESQKFYRAKAAILVRMYGINLSA